jgi:hypothetical protein
MIKSLFEAMEELESIECGFSVECNKINAIFLRFVVIATQLGVGCAR